ncbi:MAG: multidrug effflux MFS transporter [Desulfobacterales bacterium]|nr:multidrug effflux MFS transporter [Desulfobacterales bacterium]MDD4073061.1 multidrug effflux MFS transporter [Desulfobacterales bacterium]MDD4394140.1 multidrug effflux MFS transporter [Desulfobacterales bacterium]
MKKMFALLVLLTAFPALSTDMYLPAIPMLQKLWHQPLVMVNLTLIGFFVTFCVFILIYGPISDRYGRRPPLLAGIFLYIIASIVCATAPNVHWMIVARILQGAGAAAASTMSMAISKDIYEGKQREKIMAYIAVIMALAPMLAPIFGGWILTWLSWPWIFIAQAILGMIGIAGVWLMPETYRPETKGCTRNVIGNYSSIIHNRRFIGFTLAMSLTSLPMFAFIAGSSNIYMNGFGLNEKMFGYFFAFNALGLMAGSLVFSRLVKNMDSGKLITAGFLGIFCSGVWMVITPHRGPWDLALPNWIISFSMGLCRPPSNNLALELVGQNNAGTASSLIMSTSMIMGIVGMWLISLAGFDKITLIGSLAILAGGVALTFWLSARRVLSNR